MIARAGLDASAFAALIMHRHAIASAGTHDPLHLEANDKTIWFTFEHMLN